MPPPHFLNSTVIAEARSAAAIPQTKSVILSASEVSHDQSEEDMPVSSSVGFFTIVQNDV